jgi:hypothetical protein
MQNREELRGKGHDRMCRERGKISFSESGGNKYRYRTKIQTPDWAAHIGSWGMASVI